VKATTYILGTDTVLRLDWSEDTGSDEDYFEISLDQPLDDLEKEFRSVADSLHNSLDL
jgi:hypothetical protein